MSDARCEPPVHLREVDGWHWVQIADWPATVNRWVWDAHEGIGFWHPHISERTRYVSPVATPDELTRLRAELAAAREALRKLLRYAECNTCQHEETHRTGFRWEVCDLCGAKWADDEGGKPEYVDPPAISEARAALGDPA